MTDENEILQKLAKKYGLPPLQEKIVSGYKPIFFFYGGKGVGKTTAALSTPGTIDCISYDGMSMDIKLQFVKENPDNEERIRVFDIGVIELLKAEDNLPQSGDATGVANDPILKHGVMGYNYTEMIIRESNADWIIFDGVDYLVNYAEMKMRMEEQLGPYEGFKNLNLWKKRNQFLRSILTLATQKAKCGIILVGWEEISQYDEEGKTKSVKAPRWADIFKTASSIVVHISQYNVPSQQLHLHYAFIDTSKNEELFKTAERIDISGRKPLITEEKYNYILQKNHQTAYVPKIALGNTKEENKPPEEVLPPENITNKEPETEQRSEKIEEFPPQEKTNEVDNPIDNDGWGI